MKRINCFITAFLSVSLCLVPLRVCMAEKSCCKKAKPQAECPFHKPAPKSSCCEKGCKVKSKQSPNPALSPVKSSKPASSQTFLWTPFQHLAPVEQTFIVRYEIFSSQTYHFKTIHSSRSPPQKA